MWKRGVLGFFALAIIVNNVEAEYEKKPELGSSVNLIQRYENLGKSVPATFRNGSDTWIYQKPSAKIFKIPTQLLEYYEGRKFTLLMANVQTTFCFNTGDLMKEYFRHFDFEGVDQPERTFTNNWSTAVIAKHFGLEKSYVADDYCYIFLKVAFDRKRKTMFDRPDEFELEDAVRNDVARVVINDAASADRFISKFGTHYVSSFFTGDFIYQVFVYRHSFCHHFQDQLETKTMRKLTEEERSLYFSPRISLHVGKILAASGNPSVETWAAKNLPGSYTTVGTNNYSSLDNLRTNYTLHDQLNEVLQDQAVLRMELKTLAPVFKNPRTSKWFQEHVYRRLNESRNSLFHPLN